MNRRSFLGCAVAGVTCCFLPREEHLRLTGTAKIQTRVLPARKIAETYCCVNSQPVMVQGKLREVGTVLLKQIAWERKFNEYGGYFEIHLEYLHDSRGFQDVYNLADISVGAICGRA